MNGPQYRAAIPPVPPGVERPLWSVMIPTHNCASFLQETLASVLAQDPGPEHMQIEVVDDASTLDDPASVVRAAGDGRIGFVRQPGNVGHVRNFETCLRRARGRLIHLLHGDDLVLPGFYAAMERGFRARPEIGAAFCRQILADETGHWRVITPLEEQEPGVLPDAIRRLASKQRIQTPSIAVRRDVYERLGGFDPRAGTGEDWEMWIRIAAHYPVWYEPRPLAVYRMRGASISRSSARTGADVRHLRAALDIARAELATRLPPAVAQEMVRAGRKEVARRALHNARRMLRARLPDAAAAQAREALRTDRSLRTLGGTALALLWSTAQRIAYSSGPEGG